MIRLASVIALLVIGSLAPNAAADGANWMQWRGPHATGVAPEADPPQRWSNNTNIRWRTAIPGTGNSTPIIHNGRVYLTTAVPVSDGQAQPARPEPDEQAGRGRRGFGRRGFGGPPPKTPQKYTVLCLDATSGKVLWERTVREAMPNSGTHPDGTYASGSPVTDGEHVYAYFGSQGLYCLDMNGKVIWETDFVDMDKRREFGEGSSPYLYGERLVITCDHEGDSFITVLNKRNGEQLWKVSRDEPSSWATPQVVEVGGRAQIVTPGTNATRGYDLETGELIWTGPGLTLNAIPSPVIENGVAYLISGFRGAALLAVSLDKASGNFDGSPAIKWSYNDNTPYVPSPVLHDSKLYFLSGNSALLTCLDTTDGQPHYTQRIEGFGNIYSSPVATKNAIYITSREGRTVVLRPGATYEVIATNELGEGVDASPAIAGDALFIRGREHLYCIAGR